jgi:hypothetical protein
MRSPSIAVLGQELHKLEHQLARLAGWQESLDIVVDAPTQLDRLAMPTSMPI